MSNNIDLVKHVELDNPQAVVVGTWSGGKDYANLCLSSLEPIYQKYPIIVVVNDYENADSDWLEFLMRRYVVLVSDDDNYEPGALFAVRDLTNVEEFWFFQDSVEILDTSFIESSFENHRGQSFSYAAFDYMVCYIGKFVTKVLDRMRPVKVQTKLDAIQWEWYITRLYIHLDSAYNMDSYAIIDSDFHFWDNEENYIETIFGHERFVAKGNYLLKRLNLEMGALNLENLLDAYGLKNTEDDIALWRNSYERREYGSP